MFKKIIFFLLMAYAITGFILLPYFVKPQLIETIEQETNSKISIDSISFNPFIFKLQISDLELKTLDNEHLISLEYLLVDVELYSLFNSTIHLKDISLQKPAISLVYNSDKTFNILSIIKESKVTPDESNSSTEIPRIKIDKISIVEGSVSYEDFTQPSKFDFSFNHIGFNLKNIDTDDFNSSKAELRFYSTLGDGGFVDLKSKIVGFKPFVVEGSLDFEASKLYTEWRYMRDSLNLEVADGKLSLYAEYYLNIDDLNATSIHNARIALDGLRIKPKDKYKDVLNLNSLYVNNIDVKPMQKRLHIEKIGLDTLDIKAKRDAKGQVDWLAYIKVNSEESDEVPKNLEVEHTEPVQAWSVVVDKLALEKIKVNFFDKGIRPQVDTKLNELNLYAQNITLSGEEALEYQMDMRLNDKFKCSSHGNIIHSKLDLSTTLRCKEFDLVHYRPYIDKAARDALEVYNIKLIRATAGFDAKLSLKEIENEMVVDVSEANFKLEKVAINKRSNAKRLVTLGSFSVDGVALNTKSREINIKKTSLNSLALKVARLNDGSINVDGLVVPKKSKNAKIKSQKSKEYRVKLKHFALNAAQVRFNDQALTPNVESKLDRIYFNAYNIDSKRGSWLSYAFSSRVNSKGYIKSKGSLRHSPIKQKGTLELQKISLIELNPYIKEKAYVELSDGLLSIKAKTTYLPSKTTPDLRVNGSFKLNEIFVNDSRDKVALLSFNELGLDSFTLEALPNRLYIDKANIDGFYVDALINEEKELNLAMLVKKDENQTIQSAEVKKSDSNATQNSFPLKIAKLSVNMGSAKFADLSIPIKFRTHIHDLNGIIYSISNTPGETTLIDILGEIDKYGAMKLKGSLDSSNPKKFTDLDLSFSNLELNSFSGYSASFAGHEIESGKLYLDLGYDVVNSDIKGENSIIIKQMKLGAEVEDENVTSIPLGFIIGLLEDSDGVIDIDMPVEGNIDEPDFKYGTLVFKTLTNLLWKAVTSPFSFLGSMMGIDGDALAYGEFEAGQDNILPPEREKLDQIAKMMIKRPKLSLGIAGRYDEKLDTEALQLEKLISLVVKKSGIKNRDEHESAMTDDMLEDIYDEMKDDDVLDKIEEELEKKYKDEELEVAYHKALVRETIAIQAVSKEELISLAQSRSKMMKNYLALEKNIDSARVNLLEVKNVDESSEKYVKIKLEIEVK